MKNLILILILYCCFAIAVQAQDERSASASADTLHKATDFKQTIALLRSNQNILGKSNALGNLYGSLSWNYLLSKDYKPAEQMALKALQTDSTQTWVRISLAHALMFQGKTAAARKLYDELINTPSGYKKETYATILSDDFELLKNKGTIPSFSEKDFDSIKTEANRINLEMCVWKQFNTLQLSGRNEEAFALVRPHINELPKQYGIWIAEIMTELGQYCYQSERSNFPQAEKYLLEASSIYEKVLGKNHPRYATSIGNLGDLYYYLSDYSTQPRENYIRAKVYYNEYHTLGNKVQNDKTVLAQAYALSKAGNYTKAISLLQNNQKHFTEPYRLIDFYNDLAWYYLFARNAPLAEKMVLKALQTGNTQSWLIVAWLQTNLAHALLFQGKTAEAGKIYNKLAGIRSEQNSDGNETYATVILSDFQLFENAGIVSQKCHKDLQKIRSMISSIGKNYKDSADDIHAENYLLNAKVLERADTLIEAKNYQKAIDLLQANTNSFQQQELQVELYHKLSSCYLFTKAFELAEQTAQKALDLDTEIKSRLNLQDETDLGIRTNLAHALLLQGKPAKAEAIYIGLINREYGTNVDEYAAGFINDFNQFEAADIIPENIRNGFEKVKMLITGFHAEIKVWQQFDQLCDSSRYDQALMLIQPHLNKMQKKYLLQTANRLSDIAANQPGAVQVEKYYQEAMNIYEITVGKQSNEYVTALDHLGGLYKDKGNYLQSEQYYQQAKNLRENLSGKQSLEYTAALNHLAQLYSTTGNYTQAEKYYLEAKNLQPDSGHYYVTTLNDLGLLYQNMRNYLKAEKIALEALHISKTMKDKGEDNYGEYLVALHNLASLYLVMKDYARAEKYYLEEKQIIGSNEKDHPYYVNILNDLAAFYSASGNYSQAKRYYQEALQISEKWGQKDLDYAVTLSNMGLFHQHAGDYSQAEKYLLKAKIIYENALGKEDPGYAAALDNLGNLYVDAGNYAQGESDLVEAKNIREKILGKEHPDYARSLTALGVLYLYIDNYVQAEKYLQEAHTIFEKKLGKEHPDYATSLNNLGFLYHSRNDKELSEKYYLQALNIEEKLRGKDNADYAFKLGNLGSLYAATGNYTQAGQYLLEAKAIQEKLQNKEHPDYAICLNKLGSLYHKKGDYKQAEKYLYEAKEIFFKKSGPDHPGYINTIKNLELLYFAMGNSAKASLLGKELIQSVTHNIQKNFSFLSDQQRNQYWEKKKDIFDAGYSLCWYYPTAEWNGLNYDNTLFTKGLLLRTANGVRNGIYNSANKELIRRFEQLDNIHKQINTEQQKPDYDQKQVSLLQASANNLDKDLTYASTLFRDMKFGMSISWQQVQKQLQPNQAAIEFVHFRLYDKYKWTDTTLYAALVLRAGMSAPKWIPLLRQTELDSLMQPAGRDQQEQTENLYSTTGKKLYDAIWKPLEQVLQGATNIFYSPSGSLYKIAFNALPTDKGHVLLSDKYNLNFVSSTREIVRLKNQSGSLVPKGITAVYGGLTYDDQHQTLTDVKVSHKTDKQLSGGSLRFNAARFRRPYRQTSTAKSRSGFSQWSYLPGTRAEAEQIVGWLQNKHVPYKYYTANQGSEDSFKKLSGTQTGIIHLATHGFFFPDVESQTENTLRNLEGTKEKPTENPLLRSGLILSGANSISLSRENHLENHPEDGILSADEIARLNLTKTKLVVLSACETGLGDIRNSEGVFGLQRAFKLAGVESIIMSLWKVPDEATSELMTSFYQQWLSGHSKQSAFKAAQKKVRQKYKSAYYWAAFVMMD